MARSLTFEHGGTALSAELSPLDRRKVYGWVDRVALDREGRECHLGTLSGDGLYIFGRGAFEQGYMNQQGEWLESSELTAVDEEGKPVEKVTASFKETISLDKTVDVDTFLGHVISSVYQLGACEGLLDAVKAADGILTFPFNYTASYTPDPAFLIENEGTLFMLVGQPGGFEFIGLDEVESPVLDSEEEDEDEDGDAMDFSMF